MCATNSRSLWLAKRNPIIALGNVDWSISERESELLLLLSEVERYTKIALLMYETPQETESRI